MGRLKVLVITNWYPTQESPAKAVWVREHAKAAGTFAEVRVLHCAGPDRTLKPLWKAEPETDETLREGIRTYRLWYRQPPLPLVSYLMYSWAIFRAFLQIVDQGFRPDVIHVQVYDAAGPALLIGKLNRIPVVVSEHFSSFPRKLLGRLDIFKAWLAFRWADAVLPVSRTLQRAIEDYGIRAHFQVIPNAVDSRLFYPAPAPKTEGSRKHILFTGQLAPVKGVPCLLHALSRLAGKRSDWHVDIVGDGNAREEYQHLAADLRLADRVTFHGIKTRHQVAEFMRRADLFVLSSLCETFSAPAIEALSAGIPVVSTRCGGPEEFITEGVGVLVSPGDADSLAGGLDYMLDHLHRYAPVYLSQYAKERFSLERVGAQLHALYLSVTCGRQPGRRVDELQASVTLPEPENCGQPRLG
jgi:glycosyltransferase involved in cell wall biosynthesis